MPGSWADYLVTAYTFLKNVAQIRHRRWMHFPRPLALDKCFSACNSEIAVVILRTIAPFLSFLLRNSVQWLKVSSCLGGTKG